MRNQLLIQKGHNKQLKNILLVVFLFFSFGVLMAQEVIVNKYAIENTTNCNQFDVTLEVIGNPPPQPQEVVLVIDRSGSMNFGNDPKPIDFAQDAAVDFVNNFFLPANNPTGLNRVAIVSFSSTATIDIGLTNSSGQASVIATINSIVTGGGTNTEDGIVKADNVLTTTGTFDCTTSRSIILLSDGVATVRNNGIFTNSCFSTTTVTTCQTEAIQAGVDAQTTTVLGEVYNQSIFTIGLIGAISGTEESVALNTLDGIQNSGAFSTENNANLTAIYSQILGRLVPAATQISGQSLVSDVLQSGFTLVPGSINPSSGSTTNTASSISWFVPNLYDETITLTYTIESDGVNACSNQVPGNSVINYEDSSCNTSSLTFSNPNICVPCPVINPVISRLGCSSSISYSSSLNQGGCTSFSDSFQWVFRLNGTQVGSSNSQNGTFNYTGTPAFEGSFTADLTYSGSYGVGTCSLADINESSNTLTLPTALAISLESSTDVTCLDGNDGAIDISVSGGTGSYSYDWDNNGLQDPDTDTQDLANLIAGTYTVIVTDTNSGCTVSESYDVSTITDAEAPIITCPATINLNADTNACEATNVTIVDPTATDNCATTFTFTGTRSDNLPLTDPYPVGTTTITWIANDGGNDSLSCNQLVTITDAEAPIITCPATIDLNADTNACEATNVTIVDPTATDNCATTFTFTGTRSDNLALTDPYPVGTTTITWIANDGGNDSLSCNQLVTITDAEAPEFVETLPVDGTFECDNVPDPVTLTVTDSCDGDVNVDFTEERTNGLCMSNYSLERKWVSIDSNGLTTTHIQTITVQDTKAPEPTTTIESTITVSCENIPAIPNIEFTDNCSSNINEVFEETSSFDENNPSDYEIVRTWTVTDECDNQESYTQTISVTLSELVTTVNKRACFDDGTIDLNDYLQKNQTGGQWTVLDGNASLDESVFDPENVVLGFYKFSYAFNDNGCLNTTEVTIEIHEECITLPCSDRNNVIISKVVTPNGDVYNEFFTINGIDTCGFTVELQIFNRWGAKIYENFNYQNNWNGFTSSGSVGQAERVPNGTYFYIINLKDSGLEPFAKAFYVGTK
ncbi:gliding motility-associated C-terminal domain-containing protein [uncultured Algibacter sp.]|uniref:T9SS type B sorting domain-containing protein n=1 Tax=uncultured Algibacter sp. TaxID=298659 RepID=UPI00260963C3|nr:gliding motility-associated C-terminal domain-containing protein [uncultured Algibacter sp.]